MLAKELKAKLQDIVGAENVEDDNASLLAYSYDATARFQAMPDAMVAPRNKTEVAAIVKLCNDHRIPIIARGSGTNLCAGTTPASGGIVLTFKHMNRILEIDEENLTMTVEPGVFTKDIFDTAQEIGLFYPPDPGSMHISQIGGNISENSGGLRGLKYGVTRDYVLGLEVVLPNGEIIRTGGKLAKDVAGYDLTRLFVGSEGTLGVITEAILKLIPQPETKKTMLALYHNLDAAAETVSAIIANRIIPATLEFLDQATVKVVEDFAKIGLPTEAKAVLLIEQDGAPEVVERDAEKIVKLCKENHAFDVQIAKTDEQAEQLMTARRSALSALSRLKPTTILEDATVPRSQIPKMVKAITEIAEKYQVTICTFGHAGDGNLHPTCLTDARNTEEIALVEKAFAEIFEKAVALGGTITGEHGVGMMKLPYLHLKAGEAGIAAMQNIKKALDPNGIMNPGKMLAIAEKEKAGDLQ
ncbi:glycolate oxidase subunit GlcD [Virgibacillus sp. 179-BFC.A HS]|uniref:Glycolate oxidase subunit GlcD n=1 Tax=Tigheibacillus jepli TaxID=3035914 RepID=A0ABU5CDL1_9BACI|nr:glycolate oxidase subunit GlcD [Virgibacillus sp. 179-BFC.A HS]MDY0404394.1 glycolate oxidase subunit GlcD [Virgibacillus sp. 179-BFC.A HS]